MSYWIRQFLALAGASVCVIATGTHNYLITFVLAGIGGAMVAIAVNLPEERK